MQMSRRGGEFNPGDFPSENISQAEPRTKSRHVPVVSGMDPDEFLPSTVSNRGTGYARIDSIIGRRMELSKSDIGRSIGVARIVSLASKLESAPCQWLANGAFIEQCLPHKACA